jgi:hypothetical protein
LRPIAKKRKGATSVRRVQVQDALRAAGSEYGCFHIGRLQWLVLVSSIVMNLSVMSLVLLNSIVLSEVSAAREQ